MDIAEGMGSASLFELRGENPGIVHILSDEVFRIGSDAENDLILKDPGVTLYQAEINALKGQYVVRNLSLEGTAFLNGETFEETLLQKGDILTLGDSMFRFVAPGEALTQEELWRPVGGRHKGLRPQIGRFRRISLLIGLPVLVLGIVVFIVLSQSKKVEEKAQETSDRIAKLSSPVNRREKEAFYNRGVDYYSARRWDEAIQIFDKIRKDTPNYKDVETLYQKALMESKFLEELNQGKGLYMEGQWARAKEKFNEVPKGSVHFREAERLIRDIEERMLSTQLAKAKQYLASKEWVNASKEAAAILALDTNNEEALRIQKEARMMLGKSTGKWYSYSGSKAFQKPSASIPPQDSKQTKPEKRLEKEGPASSGAVKPSYAPAKGTPEWNLNMALSAYKKGDADKSLNYLEKILKSGAGSGRFRAKASAMTDNLRFATSYYHQALTLQREGRYAEALEMWAKFLEKNRNITTSRNSAFFKKASSSLSKIYFLRGEMAFDSGDLVQASWFWHMARKVNPKDKDVKKGLALLSESAQTFYRDGYILERINPKRAVEKWEVVLKIVPPDHPYYKKAKKQVERYTVIP